MSVTPFLRRADDLKEKREKLKERSSYYPKILIESRYDPDNIGAVTVDLSTLIRIEREGTQYVVHCMRSYSSNLSPAEIKLQALEKFVSEVHGLQHLYKVMPDEPDLNPVDELQISEAERLKREIAAELNQDYQDGTNK